MADYESLRRRHSSFAMAQLDEHVARLDWSGERIAAERDLRLRRLIGIARKRSRGHHDRLADIDERTFSASRLGGLAPMTKNDLLGHFDDIVTDQRLSLGLVEAHLEQLRSDGYLLDEYHAIASGGSSGQRGVYVHDWAGWATYYLSTARHIASDRLHDAVLAAAPPVEAVIAADKPSHGSSALHQTFSDPAITSVRIPISSPMSEIVARLNDLRPTALRGYPSALDLLGFEARAGRLRIAPLRLRCVGEAICPRCATGSSGRGGHRSTASGSLRRPALWATPVLAGGDSTSTTTSSSSNPWTATVGPSHRVRSPPRST